MLITNVRAHHVCSSMPPRDGDSIEEHVANLEPRLGPVRTCRVVITGPGGVNIRLALTQGLEVKVGPPPRQDERYADLTFAINDTFRRARRRLQDHVRRQPKKPQSIFSIWIANPRSHTQEVVWRAS